METSTRAELTGPAEDAVETRDNKSSGLDVPAPVTSCSVRAFCVAAAVLEDAWRRMLGTDIVAVDPRASCTTTEKVTTPHGMSICGSVTVASELDCNVDNIVDTPASSSNQNWYDSGRASASTTHDGAERTRPDCNDVHVPPHDGNSSVPPRGPRRAVTLTKRSPDAPEADTATTTRKVYV